MRHVQQALVTATKVSAWQAADIRTERTRAELSGHHEATFNFLLTDHSERVFAIKMGYAGSGHDCQLQGNNLVPLSCDNLPATLSCGPLPVAHSYSLSVPLPLQMTSPH